MPTRPEQLVQQIRRLAQPARAEPDAVLLGRYVAQSDDSAFAALVARHGPLVFGVCRRVLRERSAAEDAFQAAFLVLARKAGTVRPPERLAAWLYGVARRLALQAQRGMQRRQQHEHQATPAAPPADPLDELTARELLLALDEEVQRLPAAYRLPILLCGLEGKSQEEAAQQLGWSAGSLKGRLERGRRRLHERLARRGLTLGVALAAAEVGRGTAGADLAARTVKGALAFAGASVSASGDVSAGAMGLAEDALRGVKLWVWLLPLTMVLGIAAVGAGALQAPAPAPPASAAEPPAPKERPRRDLHGDPLPRGALTRLGTLRWRESGTIFQFAFSPDSKTVATVGIGGEITLWDTASGWMQLRSTLGGGGYDMGVAFSPDGKLLASGQAGEVYRWEVATNKHLPRLRLTPSLTDCRLFFSPDGKFLACVGRDRKESRNRVILLDAANGEQLHCHDGRTFYVEPNIAFTPDGKTWAYVDRHEKTIALFESRTGKLVRRFEGHAEAAWTVASAPDGRTLASTDHNGTLHFWETATGKLLPQQGKVWARASLNYAPDGKTLVTSGLEGRPVLYDVATGKKRRAPGPGHVHESAVLVSPDGRWLATAAAHCMYVWDAHTLKPHLQTEGHEREVLALTFSADGRVVMTAGGESGFVRRWEAATGKALPPLGDVEGCVYGCALAPDGRTVAISSFADPPGVCLFDLATGKRARALKVDKGHVNSVVFAADGCTLASGQGHDTRLWDLTTGKLLQTFPGGKFDGLTYALAPDGQMIATSGRNGEIWLWHAVTGKKLHQLTGAGSSVHKLAFSPDSRILASGHDEAPIRLWDPATGVLLREIPGEAQWDGLLVFSPDGRTLASDGRNHEVCLWEVLTGKERRRFEGHSQALHCGAFSRDGRLLATGSVDTTVLVWDLAAPAGSGAAPAALWADLLDGDARKAYQAIAGLSRDPARAVALLRDRLRPVAATDGARVRPLLAALASDRFATRTEAMRQLEALGAHAEPALRRTRAGRPTAEVRLRAQQLLDKLDPRRYAPELRTVRAIEALERIGDQDARQVLQSLADGAPEALRTREARAALARLAR